VSSKVYIIITLANSVVDYYYRYANTVIVSQRADWDYYYSFPRVLQRTHKNQTVNLLQLQLHTANDNGITEILQLPTVNDNDITEILQLPTANDNGITEILQLHTAINNGITLILKLPRAYWQWYYSHITIA
jgi:hypothetical protein